MRRFGLCWPLPVPSCRVCPQMQLWAYEPQDTGSTFKWEDLEKLRQIKCVPKTAITFYF